jgi:hypothetical protein
MAVTFSPAPTSLAWSHFRVVNRGATDAHIQPTYNLNIPNRGGVVRDGSNYRVASLTVTVAIHSPGTWVVRGKQSTALLDHERLHWMMAIIVGYEMERAILALREPTVARLNQQVRAKFTWYRGTREPDLQRKYDNDTNHGSKSAAQARWRTNVNRWYANRATQDIPLSTP